MSQRTVFFVTKKVDRPDAEETILAAYTSLEGALTRVEHIKKVNTRYPWEQLLDLMWRTGPAEDQGFFGDRRTTVRVKSATLYD